MIIGINALYIIPNKVGGTEYYLRSFIKYMSRLDKNNRYVLFCNQESKNSFSELGSNIRLVVTPIQATHRVLRVLYEQTLFPLLVAQEKCEVLHSFGYFGPLLGSFKKITTVHDANWKDHPDDNPYYQTLLLNFLISLSIKVSSFVITDSKFSKNKILKYFPMIHSKLRVIVPGIDEEFSSQLKIVSPNPLVKIHYFLCVSALYPHKNVPELLRWWAAVENFHTNNWLVLVGQNGADQKEIIQLVKRIPRVLYLTKVKFSTLVTLYKNADACIFPSEYEGFGYPVYEALAAGLPVYVTNKGMYHSSIQNNLHEINLSNAEKITVIKPLSNQQQKVTSTFNYEKSARSLIELYNSFK
jgi:glycosyltransferase involved in cell wall biosynthesis